MGRKAVGVARLSLIVVSVIFASISLLITIIAVATPAWQTVFLAEFQTEHLHGLWLDCTLTRRHLQGKLLSMLQMLLNDIQEKSKEHKNH